MNVHDSGGMIAVLLRLQPDTALMQNVLFVSECAMALQPLRDTLARAEYVAEEHGCFMVDYTLASLGAGSANIQVRSQRGT